MNSSVTGLVFLFKIFTLVSETKYLEKHSFCQKILSWCFNHWIIIHTAVKYKLIHNMLATDRVIIHSFISFEISTPRSSSAATLVVCLQCFFKGFVSVLQSIWHLWLCLPLIQGYITNLTLHWCQPHSLYIQLAR